MPVILKANPMPLRKSSRLPRTSVRTARKSSKINRSLNGIEYIETAARVIEIHYPTLPLAKNLRNVARQMERA